MVLAQTSMEEVLAQSQKYNTENITQVQQLKDLSPDDWSYEAIRSLTERYGCIDGFSDGTFQG